MNSNSRLVVKWQSDSSVEFSRSALVVIRNALIELCNGTYYPPGDPELATVIGYERDELQAALDRVNQVLSLDLRSIDADGFVQSIASDGSLICLRPNPEHLKMYALALVNVEFVRAANLWDELGIGFAGGQEIDAAEKAADLISKVGASVEEIRVLKDRLHRLANPESGA